MSGHRAEGRVSFLIAGVQKAGTTALFDYLSTVPGLQLPSVKEAHFFDDEERIDWSAPDPSSYHALFADDGRLWGEATPIYLYWPNALERIARYNPAMKLILLFRDPVERAWSHWKMEYARGKESEPFDWCIREGRARMAHAAPYPGFHRVYSYVERGFYGTQAARLMGLFPREQLLLLGSEELKRAPDPTIRRICEFLGVEGPRGEIASLSSRVGAWIPYPSQLTAENVIYLQQIYTDELAQFTALADGDVLARGNS